MPTDSLFATRTDLDQSAIAYYEQTYKEHAGSTSLEMTNLDHRGDNLDTFQPDSAGLSDQSAQLDLLDSDLIPQIPVAPQAKLNVDDITTAKGESGNTGARVVSLIEVLDAMDDDVVDSKVDVTKWTDTAESQPGPVTVISVSCLTDDI